MNEDPARLRSEAPAAVAAAGTGQPPSPRAVFWTVFPSIMLPMFLAVADQTIVATALPAIASDLGDVERLSWVVVSYLIANTIAAPVYGRLGDSFGRRRMMLAALALFIVGSVLCALAPSIEFLTATRVLQGFGGGGLMTLSQALVGETIPPRERGLIKVISPALWSAPAPLGRLPAAISPKLSVGDRSSSSMCRLALPPSSWCCGSRPGRAIGDGPRSMRRDWFCS